MACRVIRNDQDTIVSVLAPNGNESLLFNSILNDVKDSEEALLEYSTTYTSGFQTVVGNTFTNVDPQDLYDSNGEISFKVYDRLMNPERHINQMYNPDKTNLLNKKDPNLRYIQKVGSFLSEKFGYDYDIIYDTENKNKGYVDIDNYDKPTIVVNAAYATEDTVLHEYAHIFIAQIRASNKQLFSTLIKEIENTEEGKRELLAVQNFYPNLSFEEQVEEAIVELLGKYASGYFDPKSGIHRALTKIWNTIKQYIEKAFNLKISELNPNTNISDLAKILAHPTIRFREQSFAQSTLESVIERSNNNLNDEVQFLNELSQIDSPSIIKLGNYDFILNEEAYNNYLSILTNRINAIRDYITSYRFETEIKNLEYLRVKHDNGYISANYHLLDIADFINIKKIIMDAAPEELQPILKGVLSNESIEELEKLPADELDKKVNDNNWWNNFINNAKLIASNMLELLDDPNTVNFLIPALVGMGAANIGLFTSKSLDQSKAVKSVGASSNSKFRKVAKAKFVKVAQTEEDFMPNFKLNANFKNDALQSYQKIMSSDASDREKSIMLNYLLRNLENEVSPVYNYIKEYMPAIYSQYESKFK
jgi:hypothetical protein